MPTNRKRRTRNSVKLSGRQFEHLVRGYCLLFDNDGGFPFDDDKHRRKIWNDNKKDILKMVGNGHISEVRGSDAWTKDTPISALEDYEKLK